MMYRIFSYILAALLMVGGTFFHLSVVEAATLTFVRDTITSSAPATTTNHTIEFTLTNAIPASGQIVISFLENGSIVPAVFDEGSIDLSSATSTLGPYTDRDIGVAQTAAIDGVSVVTGLNGVITFDLNTTTGFPAGTLLRVELGTQATYGGAGTSEMINANITGSRKVLIEVNDASGGVIDYAHAIYFLIIPVTAGPLSNIDDTPPILSSGLPTGVLPFNTASVLMTLASDQLAHCRYSATSGIAYASSTFDFDQVFDFFQSTVITGLVNGDAYNFYVRCTDPQDNVNTADYLINFEIGVDPTATGTGPPLPPAPPTPPPSSGSSGGPGPKVGAGPGAFLETSSVIIKGKAYPGSNLTILKDGVKEDSTNASSDGSFSFTVSGLERGTYTFSIYAVDSENKKSATYSSTVYLISGTDTLVSPVFIPPTINVENDTIDPGSDIDLFGFGVPNSEVGVIINKQGNVLDTDIYAATSSVGSNGEWSLTYNTADFAQDTFLVKAYTRSDGFDASDFSPVLYIGVGGEPAPDFSLRADLNKDGYVNLVDFSILLFNWGTSDDVADINLDGTVDLTDFSIMIFFWTG